MGKTTEIDLCILEVLLWATQEAGWGIFLLLFLSAVNFPDVLWKKGSLRVLDSPSDAWRQLLLLLCLCSCM